MNEADLREKVERVVEYKNVLLKNLYNKEPMNPDDIFNLLMEYKEWLLHM